MLSSQFFLPTLREVPADAELASHRLMLRAGMIRRLASGLYAWLPLGLRVMRKVEAIVRDEMNKAGALEMLMPVVQPGELWQESGRWDQYGKELLKFTDRHERCFCLGPTHEEVITALLRHELKSYKQLPLNLYQIQTKFRDEIRPRFGVMRSREFTMKDAYSFHIDQESLADTYARMRQAYCNVFTRLGLDFRVVLADSGSIGGNASEEFHVLAQAGEDVLVYSDQSDYAANLEKATALQAEATGSATAELATIDTPNARSITDLVEQHNIAAEQSVKTMLVVGADAPIIALVLRGDHELNEIKAANLPEVASPLQMADEATIIECVGCKPGSIGPKGLSIPVIVDHAAAVLTDFCCGANNDGQHLTGVNWGRDVELSQVADLRNVEPGDLSPDGKGTLQFVRGIEVGHIFQLGTKYSDALNAKVLNEAGKQVTLQMGCYGIGVSRTVAASIEQHHDDRGIVWPEAMAPFQVGIVPMGLHKSYRVREVAEALYQKLQDAGVEVLLDDRRERPGVMFSDMDLIGVPHRIVIGERGIDAGTLEYKSRSSEEVEQVPLDAMLEFIVTKLNK